MEKIYAIFTLDSVEYLHMSVLSGKLIELLFNRMLLEKGISVTMSSESVIGLACNNCGKRMGSVSEEEFDAMITNDFGANLCFDCDPESASTTPSVFWQWQPGELIDIGDSRLCVAASGREIVEVGFVPPHERTRCARGLSSYTNLNRNIKNRVNLSNGLEIALCPVCMGNCEVEVSDQFMPCPKCDGVGTVVTAIVLPSWILGLGCENV